MENQKKQRPLRVFLWIVPRTNSTVFTKCMSFVDETEVWLEPYMACSMNETFYNPEWGIGNPNVEKMRAVSKETMDKPEYQEFIKEELEKVKQYTNVWTQDNFRYPWLKEQLEMDRDGKQFIFIKDQSCAIYDHMDYLPEVPARHIFLIRHPGDVYPSIKNLITNNVDFAQLPWDETNMVEMAPIMPVRDFFKIHRNLWRDIKSKLDPEAIVIDGYDLSTRPEVVLPKLFAKIGIPYKDSYMKWKADPELVYSSWRGSSQFVFTASKTNATSRAVESTHFVPQTRPRGSSKPEWKLTDEVKDCIDYAMPYYEEMYKHRLI